MRVPRKVWVWLGSAVAFGCAIALGWELVWLACGQYFDIGGILLLSAPLGFIEALIFSLGSRNVANRNRRFGRALVITAGATFAVLFALHFVKPVSRFAFIQGNAMAFSGTPPVLGYVEAFYTFKADPKETVRVARQELDRLGYKGDYSRSGECTIFHRQSVDGTPIAEISVCSGKAIGKHWLVDGDVIDIDPLKTDWVTVDVIQSDLLPLWLHVLVPR